MKCGGWCSTFSQWCGLCLDQNTIFCDRELWYMAHLSLIITLRLFDTVRNSWSILPHASRRRFKSSCGSFWIRIGRYENSLRQLSCAFLKWCMVLQVQLIAFLETCQLRGQPLVIELLITVVCQFLVYPLHSPFGKVCVAISRVFVLVEALFWIVAGSHPHRSHWLFSLRAFIDPDTCNNSFFQSVIACVAHASIAYYKIIPKFLKTLQGSKIRLYKFNN